MSDIKQEFANMFPEIGANISKLEKVLQSRTEIEWIEIPVEIIDGQQEELTGKAELEKSRALIRKSEIEGFCAIWKDMPGGEEVRGVRIFMKSGEQYTTEIKYKDFAVLVGFSTDFELEA